MNDFETGARKVIPATLIYAFNQGDVLMLHRKAAGDFHQGKWNGIGGKFEPGESPIEAASREFREETGAMLDRARCLGVLFFPDFKPHKKEDWLVYVLVADQGTRAGVRSECAEGELQWIPAAQLPALPLWEGDRHFIPHVLAREPFHGTFWYREGKLARYELAKF